MCSLKFTKEAQISDDAYTPSFYTTRQTRMTVPDLERIILNNEDRNVPPDFIKQDFE